MRMRLTLLVPLALFASLVGACSTTNIATPISPTPNLLSHFQAITSTDVPMPKFERAVVGPLAPKRIVSLATGVGETLVALGVGESVVGRDETSSLQEISGAMVVTKAHSVSAEKVLSLSPDLVLVDASTSPPEAIEQIRAAGVPVVEIPEAWSLTDIGARTAAIAVAVGVDESTANRVISEATTFNSDDASSTPPGATKARIAFLYLRGTSAIYLIGGLGSGADSLIEAAGSIDAGAAAGLGAFTPLTAEAIAQINPDLILVMSKGLDSVGGINGLVNLPGIAQSEAGRAKRVIAVDDTLLLSFGPRTANLVDALREAITKAMTE
ncbi:MAG: ABC transporter substrate-binding protein [Actinobacteria bacterium]|nr:MAG: ABC transporter substrate-binding protein [Actinomycetota bacterium]